MQRVVEFGRYDDLQVHTQAQAGGIEHVRCAELWIPSAVCKLGLERNGRLCQTHTAPSLPDEDAAGDVLHQPVHARDQSVPRHGAAGCDAPVPRGELLPFQLQHRRDLLAGQRAFQVLFVSEDEQRSARKFLGQRRQLSR